MTMLTAIILVGGKGTRIAHLSGDRPKPLVPVADRPFLDWLTFYLIEHGLKHFILSAGYKAEQIEEWARAFKASVSHPSLSIEVVAEAEPLGTGGALLNCLDHCGDWLVALNGDSLALFDLSRLTSLAGSADLDGAIVGLPVPDTSRYGSLSVTEEGLLAGFREKQPGEGLINAGVYLFRSSVLETKRRPGPVSIETELLPELIAEDARIAVVAAGNAPFIDIGTPATLEAATTFVEAHRPLFGTVRP